MTKLLSLCLVGLLLLAGCSSSPVVIDDFAPQQSSVNTEYCNEILASYYDQYLLCLQSISLSGLRLEYSEDVNERDKCHSKVIDEDHMSLCLVGSDYGLLGSICGQLYDYNHFANVIDFTISQVKCIQSYDYLVGSGVGIIDLRKSVDGSSFVACKSNYDCPDDEYCSIQGVQHCEKIVSSLSSNAQLVTEKQMRTIIKNNSIKSAGDTHSRVNSVVLTDGRVYIVRDVSVLDLIHEYYGDGARRTMELWIE